MHTIKIDNDEFYHDMSTNKGNFRMNDNNEHLLQVIGLHKSYDEEEEFNVGTFLGEIFDIQNNKHKLKSERECNKYIVAKINIKQEDINEEVRILNSYEEWMRNCKKSDELDKALKNDYEIKRKCEIEINEEYIPFNYLMIN